jgi:hypothetical protein
VMALFWLGLLLDHNQRRVEAGRAPSLSHNDLPREARLRRYLARALVRDPGAFNSDSNRALGDDVLFFDAA